MNRNIGDTYLLRHLLTFISGQCDFSCCPLFVFLLNPSSSCHPEERSDVRVASSGDVTVMRFLRHFVPQNDMKTGAGSNRILTFDKILQIQD